jgi:hypothetical protein
MKATRFFKTLFVACLAVIAVACYDDTELKNQISELEARIDALEIVKEAYENNFFITSVAEIANGYTISFSNGKTATITNGINGTNGEPGKDGEDGDTLIESIVVGQYEVTFTLTDGRVITIPIGSPLSIEFDTADLVAMSPSSTRSINYTVTSIADKVVVEVDASADIKAKVTPKDQTGFSGKIQITTGAVIDEYSKVIVFVSNGDKVIMRAIYFEESGLQVEEDATEKEAPGDGGEMVLEFLSNVECEVVIPTEAQSWISVVPATRALETQTITLDIKPNDTEEPRSAVVTVQSEDGALSIEYTISQEAGTPEPEPEFPTEDKSVVALQTASEGNGIDIILLGDAYDQTLIDQGKYDEDMKFVYHYLFTEEPFKSFKHLFNVYYVTAVSRDAGYKNGGDTAFDGWFEGGGSTGVGGNDNTCMTYAQKAISYSRMNEALIIVVMNSTVYAGTCWMYYPSGVTDPCGNGMAIAYFPKGTDDQMFAEGLWHEANGHGFAKLDDEYYYYGTAPTSEKNAAKSNRERWGWSKNIDFTDDESTIYWSHFLSDERYDKEGLGAFQGGMTYAYGVWRPTYNSIMFYNNGGFNAPSREAIYYRIHKLAYGSSWTYDYETFVAYDAVNVKKAAEGRGVLYVPDNFVPRHRPVVVPHTWDEVYQPE